MIDYSKLRKELDDLQSGYPDVRMKRYKLNMANKAKNVIRILPEYDESGVAWAKVFVHWGFKKYPLVCSRTFEDTCLLCQFIEELKSKNADLAKRLNSSTLWLFNVIDVLHPEEGVQVAAFSRVLARHVFSYIQEPEWAILDVDKGRNITIEVVSKGNANDYIVKPDVKGTPLLDKTVLKSMYVLHTLHKKMSTEDMEKILEGFTKGEIAPNVAKPEGPTANPSKATTPPPVELDDVKEKVANFLANFNNKE